MFNEFSFIAILPAAVDVAVAITVTILIIKIANAFKFQHFGKEANVMLYFIFTNGSMYIFFFCLSTFGFISLFSCLATNRLQKHQNFRAIFLSVAPSIRLTVAFALSLSQF